MNSAEVPAPQLGQILVAAGLLTEAQLAQALAEQAQTGRKLGEIVVSLGFLSGPALANALAEQHGGVLKTEYGYASGLGGQVARRAVAVADPPIPRLRSVDAPPVAPADVQPEREAAPPALEPEPEPEREPPPELTPAPEPTLEPPAEAPPEPALQPAAEQPPEPVLPPAASEPPEAPPEPALPPVAEPAPPSAPPATVQAASTPDQRDELLQTLLARLDAQEAELIALREALEQERLRKETAPQPAEHRDAEPTAPAAPPLAGQRENYLLCVPTEAGYVLVDRHGVVPPVGAGVEVREEEGTFFVVKVVRLPRNGRACAYLQRDRPVR